MIKSSKISQSEVLVRLQKRHQSVTARLIEKHAAARKFLQVSTIGGLLMLSDPSRPLLSAGTVAGQMTTLGYLNREEIAEKLKQIKKLTISQAEKSKALEIINQTIHHEVVEAILKRRIAAIHLDLMEDLLEGR